MRKPYELLDRQKQKSVESLVKASTNRLHALIQACAPIALQCFDIVAQLQKIGEQYQLELLLPSFFGLVMCFFGGSYMMVIVAIEAYLLCGHDTIVQCWTLLSEDFRRFLRESSLDDELYSSTSDKGTENNTVAPSNTALSNDQHVPHALQRKFLLFLRTIDPLRLRDACYALQATFFAVVSVLKIELARSVALGQSISSVLEANPITLHLIDVIAAALPAHYARWAAPVLTYLLRMAVISICLFIHRSVAAFHSAIKGGFLLSRNFLLYLAARNIIEINLEETLIDEVFGILFAFFGLLFQLSHSFALPFPLNVLLFPLTCIESLLVWLAAL